MKIAYLKSELTELSIDNLSDDEKSNIDEFVSQCDTGPGSSEMDIEWQESGKGYYAHLLELERLKSISSEAHEVYHQKLMSEIDLLENEKNPCAYMAKQVREQLT